MQREICFCLDLDAFETKHRVFIQLLKKIDITSRLQKKRKCVQKRTPDAENFN